MRSKERASLISNFCRVLYFLCFLLGNSPASEFYMPMFRNSLSVPFSNLVILHLPTYEDGTDRVFRNVGISNLDAWDLPRRKHTTRNILLVKS